MPKTFNTKLTTRTSRNQPYSSSEHPTQEAVRRKTPVLPKSFGRVPPQCVTFNLRETFVYPDVDMNRVQAFIDQKTVTIVGVKATSENVNRAWPSNPWQALQRDDQDGKHPARHEGVWIEGEEQIGRLFTCPTCVWFPWADASDVSPDAYNVRGWNSPKDFKRRHCSTELHKTNFETLFGLSKSSIARSPIKCWYCDAHFSRKDTRIAHLHERHAGLLQPPETHEEDTAITATTQAVGNSADDLGRETGADAVEFADSVQTHMTATTPFEDVYTDADPNVGPKYNSSASSSYELDNYAIWEAEIAACEEYVFGARLDPSVDEFPW